MRAALTAVLLLFAGVFCSGEGGLGVPTTFAFITVTHTRGKDYSIIQNHIQRYASMDCPIATDLNIVWNNELEPQNAPIRLANASWKRPVNFLKTPSNSMDWRYKIPKESTAQVFFIVDDDVVVDCEELQRGFKVWQANAVGSVGPLVSYAVRFYEYTQETGFVYGRKKEEKMFSLGLVGVSFMSRHFMELYYAKIELLEEMRKIVIKKNNCDDIGLNWLIQYFYPELEPIYVRAVKGNLLAGGPAVGQSTSPNHYPFRSQCILAFTKLFGVNALRYKPINDDEGRKSIRIKPLREATVLAKQKYLEAIIKGQAPALQEIELVTKKDDAHSQIISELELGLLTEKAHNKQLQEQCSQLRSQDKKPDAQEAKVIHKIPLIQILSVSVIALFLIISLLIYKLVGLTHENKFLHLRDRQAEAAEGTSITESE